MVELKTIFIYLFVHCYTLQIFRSSRIKFLKSEKVDLYLKTYSTLNKLARKTVFNFKAKKLSHVSFNIHSIMLWDKLENWKRRKGFEKQKCL